MSHHIVSRLLLALALCVPLLGATNGVVRIDTGQLTGVAANTPGVTVFKGIPYAAPPVGELRWREPKPAPA